MGSDCWSDGENGRFEDALNTYGPETPGRWELVAAAVGGGRTADDVIRHNERLNRDIHDIHAGNHPLQVRHHAAGQHQHQHQQANQQHQQPYSAQQANGGTANNNNNRRNDRRSNGGGGNNNTNRLGNNRGNRPQA